MTLLKSVKAKLLFILLGAITALSIISFIALGRMNEDMHKYDQLIHIDEHASELALKADLEFKRQVIEWKKILISGEDADTRKKYWALFNERHDTVQALVKELIPLLMADSDALKLAQQFLIDHETMREAYQGALDWFIDSSFDAIGTHNSVYGIDKGPSDALDTIVELQGMQVLTKVDDLQASSRANFFIDIIAFMVVLFVVTLTSVWAINKIIIRPLRLVSENLVALGEGDLKNACQFKSNDELGDIAETSRALHTFLINNMETMKETSHALTQSSTKLSTMSQELSQQSNEQFSSTEQVATAIQELAHSAEEVSNNSALTLEITQDTANKSASGTHIAEAAKKKSVQLVADLNESAEAIKELADNAANVSNVLDVIRAIAEQTNLLALNAAIEAARAGEQGRGFAVVADEVRTLAQRTQDSTTEIERILDNVKTGADNAVVAMDKGQESSLKTEKDITEASNALQEIADMVANINEKNIQIANASKEQTDVALGISSLISNIQGLAEATNKRVGQTQNISSELDELIKRFDQQVALFKM